MLMPLVLKPKRPPASLATPRAETPPTPEPEDAETSSTTTTTTTASTNKRARILTVSHPKLLELARHREAAAPPAAGRETEESWTLHVDSDGVMAVRALIRNHASSPYRPFPCSIPLCLLHQVMAVCRDSPTALADVERARAKGVLRTFSARTTGRANDVFVAEAQTYAEFVGALLAAAELDESARVERAALRALRYGVLPRFNQIVLTQENFGALVHEYVAEQEGELGEQLRLVSPEEMWRSLVEMQLLMKRVDMDPSVLAAAELSIPHMGRLIRELVAGRKELMRRVKEAKPYGGQILRSKLPKSCFKASALSVEYLIKDAVGNGSLRLDDTAIEGARSLISIPKRS